jgi:hypothetical protein
MFTPPTGAVESVKLWPQIRTLEIAPSLYYLLTYHLRISAILTEGFRSLPQPLQTSVDIDLDRLLPVPFLLTIHDHIPYNSTLSYMTFRDEIALLNNQWIDISIPCLFNINFITNTTIEWKMSRPSFIRTPYGSFSFSSIGVLQLFFLGFSKFICILLYHEAVCKSFRTGRLERELQTVQLSATRRSCIAIVWVSQVSFAAITLCVASQRVFIVVSVYFVIDLVRKLLDAPSCFFMAWC